MSSVPKVSIFTASKNGGHFLVDTIESVLNQTFKNYEHIIVDGASTDNTVEILKRYPHIRWISEPDSSAAEGFHKALRMCRGEYLFQCCVSDGFLDKEWFKTCVDILEKDPDISMVYGFGQYMSEDGHLGRIAYNEFFDQPPPQKENFMPFWLATKFWYPEVNYCVRREVYLDCFPSPDSTDFFDVIHPFLKFNYIFNIKGYLPYFVPLIANFGRLHQNFLSQNNQLLIDVNKVMNMYFKSIDEYKEGILQKRISHVHRNGRGEVIGGVSAKDIGHYKALIKHYRSTCHLYFSESAHTHSVANCLKRIKTRMRLLQFLA